MRHKKVRQEIPEVLTTVTKLLAKVKRQGRRVERLEVALDACLNLLSDIRYQNWPTEGLGIGLHVHVMDEVLIEAERVLPRSPKAAKTRRRRGLVE